MKTVELEQPCNVPPIKTSAAWPTPVSRHPHVCLGCLWVGCLSNASPNVQVVAAATFLLLPDEAAGLSFVCPPSPVRLCACVCTPCVDGSRAWVCLFVPNGVLIPLQPTAHHT